MPVLREQEEEEGQADQERQASPEDHLLQGMRGYPERRAMTPLEWSLIFITAVAVIVVGVNYLDTRSKREKGIPKNKRKRIGRRGK